MNKIKNFFADESGMETLEYAMIAGLIAVVALFVYSSGAGSWAEALRDRLNTATAPVAP